MDRARQVEDTAPLAAAPGYLASGRRGRHGKYAVAVSIRT